MHVPILPWVAVAMNAKHHDNPRRCRTSIKRSTTLHADCTVIHNVDSVMLMSRAKLLHPEFPGNLRKMASNWAAEFRQSTFDRRQL